MLIYLLCGVILPPILLEFVIPSHQSDSSYMPLHFNNHSRLILSWSSTRWSDLTLAFVQVWWMLSRGHALVINLFSIPSHHIANQPAAPSPTSLHASPLYQFLLGACVVIVLAAPRWFFEPTWPVLFYFILNFTSFWLILWFISPVSSCLSALISI